MNIISRIEKTSTQKLTVAILVIFSVGTIIVGFLQFKTFLEKPFFSAKLVEDKAKIRGPIEFYMYLLEQNENKKQLTGLQQRDSDMDGLTDYQEIYIYNTNPYAPDTDFDGVNDREEVARNSDPECAANDPECSTSSSAVSASNGVPTAPASSLVTNSAQAQLKELTSQMQALSEGVSTLSNDGGTDSFSQLLPEQKEEIRQYFSSLRPEDLRLVLIEQGFPPEQINALSDEDLKMTMDQLLSKLQ